MSSKQIPKNSNKLIEEAIRNSDIDLNEYLEYLESSTIRLSNTEDKMTPTILVQNSASEVARFNNPAKDLRIKAVLTDLNRVTIKRSN